MKDGLQGVGGWPSEAAGKAIGCGGGRRRCCESTGRTGEFFGGRDDEEKRGESQR